MLSSWQSDITYEELIRDKCNQSSFLEWSDITYEELIQSQPACLIHRMFPHQRSDITYEELILVRSSNAASSQPLTSRTLPMRNWYSSQESILGNIYAYMSDITYEELIQSLVQFCHESLTFLILSDITYEELIHPQGDVHLWPEPHIVGHYLWGIDTINRCNDC